MSVAYDQARELARQLVSLEITRKETQDKQKALKDELLALIEDNTIETTFEFDNGLVYLDETTSFKIADGLQEETEVTSKSPDKLDPEFIKKNFDAGLKLSKQAKKAIREGNVDILAVVVPETKQKIKINVRED